MNLDGAQMRARRFVEERDWVQFHTPKNLTMALVCEVAELAEIFQWQPDLEPGRFVDPDDLRRAREELADVQIYVLRLADVLGIDLERAVESKQILNEQRYPIADSKRYVARYARGSLPATFNLRPYRSDDADAVVQLVGDALDQLYPSGRKWLDRKLGEVTSGGALCTLAEVDAKIVGLSIETLKQPRQRKLSTLWVDAPMRGKGIGSALLRQCRADWYEKGVQEVYATASPQAMRSVMPLLVSVGFRFRDLDPGRYGPDRHEIVLEWTLIGVASS